MPDDRLLIIDDERDIREAVKAVAEDMGFAVATAGDHTEFGATYADFAPTVIVLDLMLPDVDGVELLRKLAEDRCKAAIVLISGSDSRVLATAVRLGADQGLNVLGSLAKPLMLDDLEGKLQGALTGQPDIGEAELRAAIEQNQLLLHYQPKLNLKAPRQDAWTVDAVEALVRWDHPKRGLLQPDAFIPLAEQTGLVKPLTWQVFEMALAQVSCWTQDGYPVKVSINLPTQCLDEPELPDQLARLAAKHDVNRSQLVVELTETGAMQDAALTMEVLTRVRLKGIGLAIDDVGTGYSSLLQLHRMPFSELKIDKSFVCELPRSKEAQVLVQTMCAMGKHLGMAVCAEGVENAETLDILRAADCDTAQGYHISKPLPAPQLQRFFARAA